MNPQINYAQFDGIAIAVMDYYVKQSETDAMCIETYTRQNAKPKPTNALHG